MTVGDASGREVREAISAVKSCVLNAAVSLLISFSPFIIHRFISHCYLLVDLGRDLYFVSHRSHSSSMAC